MPIYEYVCKGCERRFELILLGRTTPSCPHCGGTDLDKAFSVFAVGASRGPAPKSRRDSSGCGTCGDPRGPGSCSMN